MSNNSISLNIHENIIKKLDFFIHNKKIPHIIFHGPSGCGKKRILSQFVKKVYNYNTNQIKEYVMEINCAHNKGIRFIRDELKFFAKSNIQNNTNFVFKSIILLNSENLTIDAQSALRRCIEKFSHTTRFFIVVENKDSLLKPILSRFCDIFIPYPIINNIKMNIHSHNISNIKKDIEDFHTNRYTKLKKHIYHLYNAPIIPYISLKKCLELSKKLYYLGYSSIDLLLFVKKENIFKKSDKYLILIYFEKNKKEFRNEELTMYLILYFIKMRKNINLKNILSM